MKKASIFLSGAIISLLLLFSTLSYSSYYAYCNLTLKVNKVLSTPFYSYRTKKFAIKVDITIARVGKGGGHNDYHCSKWKGRMRKVILYFTKSKTVAKIKAGRIILVKYTTASGKISGPRRFYSSQSWNVKE